jgi:ankyrin repeat protein
MMKKILVGLGIFMIILVLAAAGGSYYAYQHRHELTKKAVNYAMQNIGSGFLAPSSTPTKAETNDNSDGLGSLLNMFGVDQSQSADLGSLAQNLLSAFGNTSQSQGENYNSGSDINARDQKGRTLLMNICRTDASAKVIKMILQYGADVNALDNNGRTALMYAVALNQDPEVVALLIAAGASRKARDYSGKSVFEYAANSEVKEALKR